MRTHAISVRSCARRVRSTARSVEVVEGGVAIVQNFLISTNKEGYEYLTAQGIPRIMYLTAVKCVFEIAQISLNSNDAAKAQMTR